MSKLFTLFFCLTLSVSLYAGYDVKIIGKTADVGVAYSPAMSLYASIDGSRKKTICRNKKLSRNRAYEFSYNSVKKDFDSITIKADDNDAWWVDWFIFELPNGEVWKFSGDTMYLSKQKSDILDRSQQELTFYFTGSKAGTISSKNPFNQKPHQWEEKIKGIKITKGSITDYSKNSGEMITCPKCGHTFIKTD